ncbi:MAG: cyclic nucleotide-binding domain-containing protein [Pseudomonadota bacterium]
MPLSELSRLRLFRDLPEEPVRLLEGAVRRAAAVPDETILEMMQEDEPFRYFFFLVQGQVKVVGFDDEARPKVLNFLRKGEFFVDKSITWRGQVSTKVIAITDVELWIVPRESLRNLAQEYPPFHEMVLRLGDRIDYRNRIYTEDKYARSVLEFLIRTELTQASSVKITQMDKCIECDTCYQACEDRHGFQRLSRGYARFGILDFAQSCITCFYPACIPPCPVDAIVFSPKSGQVEILDNCIGCAACAHACQYGAIRMHRTIAGDSRFARFKPENPRVKLKFVADKCDHCDGYDDMTCITSCPTGAIIEVEATDLLENPKVFGADEGGRRSLPSMTESGWFRSLLQAGYVAAILFFASLLGWEALALTRWPALSVLSTLQRDRFVPADFTMKFEKGSDLCVLLGNVGFVLVLFSLLYPFRKAFPRLFKHLGRKPVWLDFHNSCGILGTIFVLFHTGLYFPFAPASFAYLSLVLVMLSGIFGRFLYMTIPRGVAGTELKMRDIEEEDAAITQKLDALFGGSERHRAWVNRIVASLTHEADDASSVLALIRAMIQTRLLLLRFRLHPPAEVRDQGRQIGVFLRLLHRKIRLARNVAFLGLTSRLFVRWQYVHRPFAYALGALATGHVIYNVLYFNWGA